MLPGVLDGVRNISRTPEINLISWHPPKSANLSNAEPDIAFCLEVYNTTCGNGNSLINLCDLMEPRYIYGNDELHPHKTYGLTVIPRSNIEGASNGSAATKNGKSQFHHAHRCIYMYYNIIEVFRSWGELPKTIIRHRNRSNLVNVEIQLDDTVRS